MRGVAKAVIILLAGAAVGLLAVAQARNVQLAGGDVSISRMQQLNEDVASLRQQKAGLEAKLEELNKQTTQLGTDEAQARKQLEGANAALEDARAKAGMTELSGSGIVVVVSARTYGEGGQKKIVKAITDEELLLLVNELNAAGAEAVSINGQRLASRSAIRLAGNFVNINLVPTAMPYEIRALGDAQTLEGALRLYGGIYDTLTEFYEISIKKTDKVDIPAYKGKTDFRYATSEGS